MGNKTRFRWRLWMEQDRRCCYCEREVEFADSTIEHFIPKSKGGTNSKENLVMACYGCNYTRGKKELEVFLKMMKEAKEKDELWPTGKP